MTETKKGLSPTVKYRVWRLFLWSLPFFPVPGLYELVRDLKRSQSDLDHQVIKAIESLQHSSELVSQLEEKLKERSDKLHHLREEYERYSKLAEVEEKKVEAMVQQMEITLGKGQRHERLVSLGLNFMLGFAFFMAGVMLANPLRSWFE